MNQLIEIQNKALAAEMRVAGCGEAEAIKAVAVMVGGYASLSVHDVKTFTAHLTSLLAEYPADVCAEAAKEIPRAERYLNIAAVKEWMEERMKYRRSAYQRAMDAKRQAEERAKYEAEQKQIAAENAEFKAWLESHPGGSWRQYLGLIPYTSPLSPDF